MKKIITTILATLIFISSSFAFDTDTFWKQYPKAIKTGANIASVGIGINAYTVSKKPKSMIPEISASFEKAMYFIDMLPISVGGYLNFYGVNYLTQNPPASVDPAKDVFTAQYIYFNIGALAKYHFDLEIDNLDVYAGTKIGLNFTSFKIDGEKYDQKNKYTRPIAMDLGFIMGGTYYFASNMGASLETGFPGFLNFQFNYKF
ncbi:MAG: hypothetical protein K5829_06055 [Treponema sp.]|nr:hypothetical protein [Treponema sp.]